MVHLTETLTRPNGKLYRPTRKMLWGRSWENENDGHEEQCGIIVFGTLNAERARPLAVELCRYWFDMIIASKPSPAPGWYRDTFRWGERTWAYDELRGAPGVMFWAATE